MEMKSDFKNLLRKFCLDGSVLGLKYFYLYPDKLSRCFWAIVMISILSSACTLTWLLYDRFQDMPTRITIENQHEPMGNMPYPTITICSPNQIFMSSMKHFVNTLVDGNLSLPLDKMLPQLLSFYEVTEDINHKDMQNLHKLFDINRYDILEVMSALPQSCDNFLKLCYLEQQRYPCRELFVPLITKNGYCCAFNSMYYFKNKSRNEKNFNFEARLATKTGVANGLTVVADYELEDAMNGTVLYSGAIKVMFSDWTEFPTDDEVCLVSPHTEFFLSIGSTYTYCSDEVKYLPSWSRGCYFEDEMKLHFFKHYHNFDCETLCIAQALERHCHCMPIFMPYVTMDHVCETVNLACIIDFKLNLHRLPIKRCECPRDCESRRYRIETNSGNLDALPYIAYKHYDNVIIKESTTLMHFFFPRSVYTKQKQETVVSLISLQANLGGIFGLCLGCSIISVLEIVFYLYICARNYIRNSLSKRDHRRINFLTENRVKEGN